jgi:hypothetical protein
MVSVHLEKRPIPVPLIYQPVYKIVVLLGVLKYNTSRPHSAPFITLHLLFWSLRSDENHRVLHEIKDGTRRSILPWSFEPGLDKTATLAIVNGFCEKEIKSKALKIKLTDKGEALLARINEMSVFQNDLQKLREIGIVPLNKIHSVNQVWALR